MIYPIFALQSNVQLQFLDLDATGNATLGKHVAIDGQLVGSRLIGNVMYLVTTYSPRVPYELLPAGATAQQKSAALDQMTSADFLPTWRADASAAEALLADTDCYVHPTNRSLALEVTTITAIDLGSPTLARASRCFVGGTEAVYMAPTNLYLATTRFPSPSCPPGSCNTRRSSRPTFTSSRSRAWRSTTAPRARSRATSAGTSSASPTGWANTTATCAS